MGATAVAGGAVAAACPPEGQRLQVDVAGVRNARGQVAVTVYPDVRRRFLAPGGRIARSRVPAAAGVTSACLAVPGPGWYAVAVYHDENGDRDFNRTRIGLPAEGFAFSNDAPTITGLPAFSAVRFRAGAGVHRLPVRMRYR